MVPVKSKYIKSPKLSTKSKPSSSTRNASKKSTAGVSRQPPKQLKTKPSAAHDQSNKKQKKSQKVYTDKELGLEALNMITPAGITKPRGKKKGKIFVDDPESMMTILAMVNAEEEGQIESKIMKARQMEEIREAKRKEQESKAEMKKEKMEAVKNSLRRKRKNPKRADDDSAMNGDAQAMQQDGMSTKPTKQTKSGKKRVSFA